LNLLCCANVLLSCAKFECARRRCRSRPCAPDAAQFEKRCREGNKELFGFCLEDVKIFYSRSRSGCSFSPSGQFSVSDPPRASLVKASSVLSTASASSSSWRIAAASLSRQVARMSAAKSGTSIQARRPLPDFTSFIRATPLERSCAGIGPSANLIPDFTSFIRATPTDFISSRQTKSRCRSARAGRRPCCRRTACRPGGG
jgi:hypothetical protein